MMRAALILLLLVAMVPAALAGDWPDGFPHEGECTVCARRGAAHGAEKFVDWREFEAAFYGFCSEPCAEAFDQMPAGYAPPVLPRTAPAFAWTTLSGQTIEPAGQPVLLVDFWATWCAPCIQAMPDLEAIAAEFEASGLRVIGVSIDEDLDKLEAFLKRRPVGYPVVHDGGEDPAWWQFQVPAIPAAFLLNGQGEIVAQWSGEIEAEQLRTQIQALVRTD